MAVRRERMPLNWTHAKFYAVSALLALVFPYLSIFIAAPNLPVGVLSMDFILEPAFTYLLALIFAIERFRGLRFAGLLTGVAGIMLIVLPEASLPEPGMVTLGDARPGRTDLVGGLERMGHVRPPAVPPLTLTTATMGCGALFLLPLMLGIEGW
jgi:drug/metabolite transporter (DMT)-like permease